MKFFSAVAVLVLSAASLVVAADTPTELKIETTHMPDVCEEKAQTGDFIDVHYVCPRHRL